MCFMRPSHAVPSARSAVDLAPLGQGGCGFCALRCPRAQHWRGSLSTWAAGVAALSGDWEYPISVLKTWGVAQVDALVPSAASALSSNVSVLT